MNLYTIHVVVYMYSHRFSPLVGLSKRGGKAKKWAMFEKMRDAAIESVCRYFVYTLIIRYTTIPNHIHCTHFLVATFITGP